MQQDPAQTSANILAQISLQLSSPNTAPAPAPSSTPFEPDPNDVAINMLWVLSLTLSLVAAFFAIAVQQWLRAFPLPRSLSVQDAVRLRHSRFSGLIRWQIPDVITLLPVLLQVAVVLFLVGLYLLLRNINHPISTAFAAVSGLPFFLYAVTLFLPLIDPNCPFKSPLVPSILWLFNLAQSIAAVILRAVSVFITLVFLPMVMMAVVGPIVVVLITVGFAVSVTFGPLVLLYLAIFSFDQLSQTIVVIRTSYPRPSASVLDAASSAISSVMQSLGEQEESTRSIRETVYIGARRTLKMVLKTIPRRVTTFIFKISKSHRSTIPVPITKQDFWTDRDICRLPRADSSEAMPGYVDALAWAPHAIQFYSLKDVEPCLRTLSQSRRSACIVAWAALYLGNHHIDSVAAVRGKIIWSFSLPRFSPPRSIRHCAPIKPNLVIRVNRAFAEEFKGYLANSIEEALLSLPGSYSTLPSLSGILILATQIVINRAEPRLHLTLVPALMRLFEGQSFGGPSGTSSHYPAVCLFRCCALVNPDERYVFTAQGNVKTYSVMFPYSCHSFSETRHLMDIFDSHLSIITDLPQTDRDWIIQQNTVNCVFQEMVLASAATIFIALSQQARRSLESDSNPCTSRVSKFLTTLQSFVGNMHRRIQDVGLLYRQSGASDDSFIATPGALKIIAESLLHFHVDDQIMPGSDSKHTLSLVEMLLNLCIGESVFENAVQCLLVLLPILRRLHPSPDRTSSTGSEQEEAASDARRLSQQSWQLVEYDHSQSSRPQSVEEV